jgi:DNA-binding NarL/FixJ family response regulator
VIVVAAFDLASAHMSKPGTQCVLVADPHHAVSEGMRSLLATTFQAVVMVADEASLFESAGRLRSDLAIVDLALARGNAVEFVRRLRSSFPDMKMIVVSVHDRSIVSDSVLEVGADGFVAKRALATDLLPAADAVLAGHRYVSPSVMEQRKEDLV